MSDRSNAAFQDQQQDAVLVAPGWRARSLAEVLVGQSRAMVRVRELILKLAPVDLPVLISGETGTGKELVADALHRQSGRRSRFVPFNVCAIPDSLFDAAISGHVAGAYTGAIEGVDGFLVEAHDGTVFLDEISSLSLVAQAKLLRVLESRSVRPVGGRLDRVTDCRIVAATNAHLERRVAEQEFRSDLLYRLRGAVITLPPLRDRREDISFLARRFLDVHRSPHAGRARLLTRGAERVLEARPWPGNVRELRRTLEFAAVLAEGGPLEACHVLEATEGAGGVAVRSACDDHGRELIELLRRHKYSALAVAKKLGVTPKTVYHRLQRNGVSIRTLRRGLASEGATEDVQHPE